MLAALVTSVLLISLQDPVVSSPLGHAITHLAFRLDAHVTHRLANENSALSPLAVSGLLAMFVPGAEGDTKNEILNVLQIKDMDSLDVYREMYAHLEQNNENVTILEIASRIYTRFGLKLSGDYARDIFTNFGADIKELDFSGDPTGSQRSINDWFANKTRGHFDKLLPIPVPVDTFMLVLNAVYFKSFWKLPFDVENTKIGKFYMSENDGMNMMMMKQTDIMLNVMKDHDKKFTLVELPNTDSRTAMLILLPDVGNSLNDVMHSINSSYFLQQLDKLTPFKVTLTLPRFKLQVGYELSAIFESLGVGKLFQPEDAELMTLFGSHGYYAQQMIHSVAVDVTETGTEASGTGYTTIGLSMSPSLELNVNRPFMFMIYDIRTECVLFMGRMLTPPSDTPTLMLGHQDGHVTDGGNSLTGYVSTIILALLVVYSLTTSTRAR